MGIANQNRGWRKRGEVPNEPMRNVDPAKYMDREGGVGDYKDQIYDRNNSFLFPSGPR